jgi:uroporphyrinogen decarboxylase
MICQNMALLDVLSNKNVKSPPPVWFMRQAGRYLPEYRAERQKHPDFMNFCFTPDAVTKVTLQPIERFDFDAAIIFSDILTIPHLLGQNVSFHEGIGPVLEPVSWDSFLDRAEKTCLLDGLTPVLQGISQTRQALASHKALIGFCGSPWTVATYMINGGKNTTFHATLSFTQERKDIFHRLLATLERHIGDSLKAQIQAGCQVVQIFDSWASAVPEEHRNQWLFEPLERICAHLNAYNPHVPIIYYGRGISKAYDGVHKKIPNLCFGVDETADLSTITPYAAIQGNLCPKKLAEGGFEATVQSILTHMRERPFVFNLGHGILPHTPIEHVYQVLRLIRSVVARPL